jgi:hypothetical protein
MEQANRGHSEVIPDSGPCLASFDDDPKVGRVFIFIPDSFPVFKIPKNLFHHAFFCSLADAKTTTIQVWKLSRMFESKERLQTPQKHDGPGLEVMKDVRI